jgi:hypothetical protein
MSFDPARELPRVLQQYDTLRALLEAHPQLRSRRSHLSGWSAEEHIAHVTLANELVLRNLGNLLKGSGLLVMQGGDAAPGALELLQAGSLPRGQAQSPRMVRPPAPVDVPMLLDWLREGRAGFAALDPARIASSGLKIPHQVLGPLDAPEWLRFAAVHTRHHLGIACEVLAALGATDLPTLSA